MVAISKKFGQLRQWTNEKFGSAGKTDTSEDFKRLEASTELRREGIEQLHSHLSLYFKTFDKKKLSKLDTAQKQFPVLLLSNSMSKQAKFLGSESNYAKGLISFGETLDKIAEEQSEFLLRARGSFFQNLDSLLADMKQYQNLKKKLKNRRLDYDARLSKIQRSKKEKPELEEDMKIAQAKYEQTLDDIEQLMLTFEQKEESLIESLVHFSKQQSKYFDSCSKHMTLLVTEMDKMPKDLEKRFSEFSINKKFTDSDSILNENLSRSSSMAGFTAVPAKASEKSTEKTTSYSQKPENPGKKPTKTVKAIYDFEAETSEELTLRVGSIITVLEEIDEGWWIGESEGRIGMFPANYVEPVRIAPQIPSKSQKPKPVGFPPAYESDIAEQGNEAKLANEFHSLEKKLPKAGSMSKFSYLKDTANDPRKREQAVGATASAIQMVKCKDCGCDDYSPNVFKKGSCNNCFHRHE